MRSLTSIAALAVLCATANSKVNPPDTAGIVAKPEYVALIRAMREDELIFITLHRHLETQRLQYHPRCLPNLRADMVRATLAFAIEKKISPDEVAKATQFYQSDVGRKFVAHTWMQVVEEKAMGDPALPRFSPAETLAIGAFGKTPAGEKLLVKRITHEKPVVNMVMGEMRERLYTCTTTLKGERSTTYCTSGPIFDSDSMCAARYTVAKGSHETTPTTNVGLVCEINGGHASALVVHLPGRQETIGLSWKDNRTLQVLLPDGVKPSYQAPSNDLAGVKYDFRTRTASDPVTECIPAAPLDEFGWPKQP